MTENSETELREFLREDLEGNLCTFSGKQLERASKILDHLIDCETLLISDDSTAFKLFDKPLSFVEYLSNVTDEKDFTTNLDYDRVTLALIDRGAPKELFLK